VRVRPCEIGARPIAPRWPQGDADTDEYRKGRAVQSFNSGARVANDLLALKPTMLSWVPHITVFIDPRQQVELGDPSRRACDACESFGAMTKKIIKHSTCRRRLTSGGEADGHGVYRGSTARRWKTTLHSRIHDLFEQAFRRACVRESLAHGKENAPYLRARDHVCVTTGKAPVVKKTDLHEGTPVPPIQSIYELAQALRDTDQVPA
jgi:hypothetical protein